jgi:hypothetical protein
VAGSGPPPPPPTTTTTTTTTPPPPPGHGPPGTCSNATKKFGVLYVQACFLERGGQWLASGNIDADGLSIVPSSCTSVVFDHAAGTITSACNQGGNGEVAVSLSGIPLYRGPLAWTIPTSSGALFGQLNAGAFADLKGFAIVGQISVMTAGAGIDVMVNTDLPAPLDVVHGSATLRADLQHGLELSSLDISASDIFLGPVEVNNFFIDYTQSTDTWPAGRP